MDRVIERYQSLQLKNETINLFALVDGYQYEQHTGIRMQHRVNINRPIFVGTEDESLSVAGPWLIDMMKSSDQLEEIELLERALPSVSWIITSVDLEGLSQLLQLRLDVILPDGRTALLRFFDPRVLGKLDQIMNSKQRAEFFHLIDEWHFVYNGQRVVTGTNHA